jgi:hypothetical protein
MGKTSYARYLASVLAKGCLGNYGSRIPILLNLGEYTTAPSIENLIVQQVSGYSVRHFSSAAFRTLNKQGRFVLLSDGFDEMKFAMAPNDFAFFASQMRDAAKINPRLLLLGRPDAVESDVEVSRLTSALIPAQDVLVKADDGPEFENVRLAFLTRDEYLLLIQRFLRQELAEGEIDESISRILGQVQKVDLDNILERPVQAKMLAEVVTDKEVDITSLSRFSLYALFIQKILRREEEKACAVILVLNLV